MLEDRGQTPDYRGQTPDYRGQMTDDRKQMKEIGIRKADPPLSDRAGLWRGEDGEVGRKKSEFEKWNSEKINQLYTLYLRPYALRLIPCPYNLISDIRNLISVMSDVLIYALCPMLYAPYARNS
jgi:hypothetical protein